MSRLRFIDIGANLVDGMYKGVYPGGSGSQKHPADLQAVLQRAYDVGVEKLLITGTNLTESREALELAKTDEKLFSSVGCHPTRCKEFESHPDGPEKYSEELEKILNENPGKIAALGEFGLDYDRLEFCDKETQIKYFKKQLEIGVKTKKPMFLHNRNSTSDLVSILKPLISELGPGVVHSFDGSLEDVQSILDLGLYIGINGCSLKTEENLKVVAEIPINRLMIETDCPWCEIRPTHAGFKHVVSKFEGLQVKRDKWKEGCMIKARNEPRNIVQVLEVIAAVKGIENPQELAETIYENSAKVFFP